MRRTMRLVLDVSFVYWSSRLEKVEEKCPSVDECRNILRDCQVGGRGSPRQLDSRLFVAGCEQIVTEIPGFHPFDHVVVPESPSLKEFLRSPQRYVRCVMDVNYGLRNSTTAQPSWSDCETHLEFWYRSVLCNRFHKGYWLWDSSNLGVDSWVVSWGGV